METMLKQVGSEKEVPTLQLNRQLVAIESYAARLGVTTGIIEECGKLGIIRLRKFRGKTFVIDLPIFYPYETRSLANSAINKTAQAGRIAELVKLVTSGAATNKQSANPIFISNKPKSSSTPAKIQNIQVSLAQSSEDSAKCELKPSLIDNCLDKADDFDDLQISDYQPTSEKIWEIEENPVSLQPPALHKAPSARIWQYVAIGTTAFCCVLLFAYSWVFIDRKIQVDQLAEARANIKLIAATSALNVRQAKSSETELNKLKNEIERLRTELKNSQEQLKTTEQHLDRSRQDLKSLELRSSQAAGRLNEQIRRLGERLPKISKDSQIPAESQFPGIE